MKVNYFKSGAIAYMLLGSMHLFSHLLSGNNLDPQMTKTLAEMKNTIINIIGEHTLWQFYEGFSLTMGFLLIAFGLQAYMIDNPNKRIIITNIIITLVILVLTIKYFHLIASAFMLLALICFFISLKKQLKYQ